MWVENNADAIIDPVPNGTSWWGWILSFFYPHSIPSEQVYNSGLYLSDFYRPAHVVTIIQSKSLRDYMWVENNADAIIYPVPNGTSWWGWILSFFYPHSIPSEQVYNSGSLFPEFKEDCLL
jgi:hypothetical protein